MLTEPNQVTEVDQLGAPLSLAQTDKTILFNLPNSNLQVECKLTNDFQWQMSWINIQAAKVKIFDRLFSTSQMIATTAFLIDASKKDGIYR